MTEWQKDKNEVEYLVIPKDKSDPWEVLNNYWCGCGDGLSDEAKAALVTLHEQMERVTKVKAQATGEPSDAECRAKYHPYHDCAHTPAEEPDE